MGTTISWGARGAQAQTTAEEAWTAGDHAAAERLYLGRLSINPGDEQALHRVALIRAWNSRFESSLELFDRLLAISPNNSEAAVDRARVLGWRGDLRGAVAALDSIIHVHPTYQRAMDARADFAAALERGPSGVQGAKEPAAATDPQNRALERERAKTLMWSDRYDEAIAAYERLALSDPNDRDALVNLARVLSWSGELDSAASIYSRLLARSPADLEALRGRARTTSWGGDILAAEAWWRRALAVDSNDVEALVGLAQTLRWQGRQAAALEVLSRAGALDPSNDDVVAQQRWTRLAVDPRVNGNVAFERDSDGNSMVTSWFRASWRPILRTEITAHAYRRSAGFDTPGFEGASANGVSVDLWTQREPGWVALAGLGISSSSADAAGARGTFRARVETPLRNRVSGGLSFSHAPYDYTAPLMTSGVMLDEWSIGGRMRFPRRLTVEASLALGTFHGSQANHRTFVTIVTTKRLGADWSLGTSLRAYGFTRDLNDGYFDPSSYVLAEALGIWTRELGRWVVQTQFAPGLQGVRGNGSFGATLRASGRISYLLSPGQELSLEGTFSSAGLRSFSATNADYRYRALTFGGAWLF
jgi:tetratricopeptide (TPR) repeat protein